MAQRKQKKNHRGAVAMIILFMVVIAAAVGVLVWYFWFRDDGAKASRKAYDTYVNAVTQADYEGIYALVHEDVKAAVEKERIISRYTNILSGIDARDIAFTLLGSEETDGIWYYRFKMQMNTATGPMENTYTMQVCKDGTGEYKILWNSNLIFPQLGDDDKVRVNPLPASRGAIYDAHGNALALDGEGANVGIVPGKLSETTKAADIAALSELLEVSEDYIYEQLGADWVTDEVYVPIRNIAGDDQELIDAAIAIPGIMVSTTSAREYPYGKTLAHLIGYVQGISAEELETMAADGYDSSSIVGKNGLEKLYESSLRGIDGCEILILNSDGSLKETLGYKAPQNGKDVRLTLDARLCQILYNALGEDKGLAAAMNAKTGEVLSLVSTPSYNPNAFVAGLMPSRWEALNSDERLPLYNRYAASWVPGSVFKSVTAGIGLSNGSMDPTAVTPSNGLSWKKDASWGNLSVTTLQAYGDVTMERALTYSDNIYFAKETLNMGQDSFVQGLEKAGFGEDLPFAIGLETSTYGSLKDSADEILLANSGYGQGELLVNPVHLLSIYTAFLNDGNMIQPYLVSNEGALGKTDAVPGTVWKSGVFTPEAAVLVDQAMEKVVLEGTGTEAQIAGLALAGKTGTAEIKASQADTTGTELGWFIGYEADDDQSPIMILMMVEDVKERGGSHYVVPKVAEAFDLYQNYGASGADSFGEGI